MNIHFSAWSTNEPRNLGYVDGKYMVEGLAQLSEIICDKAWAPSVFSGNKRRNSEFNYVDLLVLDIDEGCTLQDARSYFSAYKHIIATTRNHQKPKNGEAARDRFRVILPLSTRIKNKDDFATTWQKAYSEWSFIDAQCKDLARFYYPCKEVISVQEEGQDYWVQECVPEIDSFLSDIDTAPIATPTSTSEKGLLSRSTLEFIATGAPSGYWHGALVKACFDLKEQKYNEQEAIDMLQKATGHLDNEHDLKTIADIYSNRVTKYELREDPRKTEETGSLVLRAHDTIDEAFDYLNNKDKVMGTPTGIEGLDRMLGGGYRTGEVSVLMALAKTGKNALYHYQIYKALTEGRKIAYASRELTPSTEVMPNLWSIHLTQNIFKATITEQLKQDVSKVTKDWPLYFANGYGYIEQEKLHEWLTEMKALGIDSIWMDHLHYMLFEPEDHKESSKLIKNIKTWAKELDIHVNLIVQPNRLEDGARLSLNKLKGGSAIGQALDNLLILERYRCDTPNISTLRLEIARHKLAKPGKIYLQYETEAMTFHEVEPDVLIPTEQVLPDFSRPQGVSGKISSKVIKN
jgi:KaiC/GvpD/RAD55 family RecA-like ATPase